jgi:prophage maintenance system killer protein/prophage antirepressor-like protein
VNDPKELSIYQAPNGAIELNVDARKETIWATQAQIAKLFNVDQSGVARHIKKILAGGEVDSQSNMQKMHNANSDKPVNTYNLDVILAVGYRTNSASAVQFRQWATQTLRQYITNGYAINGQSIEDNYSAFLTALEETKRLLPNNNSVTTNDTLDLITLFASTWFSLDAYDKSSLPERGINKQAVIINTQELRSELDRLKEKLISHGQASELFSQEKHPGDLDGIIGSIFQTFDGKDLYPSIEEKAAHLIYFVIKNHPFNDGNKRSGAFAFVWFLQRANSLNTAVFSPEALTSLTLLIAESDPKEKERMIRLVLLLLGAK